MNSVKNRNHAVRSSTISYNSNSWASCFYFRWRRNVILTLINCSLFKLECINNQTASLVVGLKQYTNFPHWSRPSGALVHKISVCYVDFSSSQVEVVVAYERMLTQMVYLYDADAKDTVMF